MNTEQMREALQCCIAALERVHHATEADRLAAADKARAALALPAQPQPTDDLPEPELGYIATDKSRQPAFSARQMREFRAAQPQVAGEAVSANVFVQPVPDHCDRIVWRNSYYHLPITTPSPKADTEQAPVKLAPSRKGRVYVAGPMTGIEDFNFPAFNQAAEELRTLGLTVLNPADHGVVEGATWADYLRHDIALLATCERIHLLPGWPKSKGARLELHIAQTLGLEVTTSPGAELPAEAEPVRVPEGWGFREMSPGSITVQKPSGYACTLWKSGHGGVESLAYEMATMLTAAPQAPADVVRDAVINAARAVADASTELDGEDFRVPSHEMAVLSLNLDELDAAMSTKAGEKV